MHSMAPVLRLVIICTEIGVPLLSLQRSGGRWQARAGATRSHGTSLSRLVGRLPQAKPEVSSSTLYAPHTRIPSVHCPMSARRQACSPPPNPTPAPPLVPADPRHPPSF